MKVENVLEGTYSSGGVVGISNIDEGLSTQDSSSVTSNTSGGTTSNEPLTINPNLLPQNDVLPINSTSTEVAPTNLSCEEQWQQIAMTSRFATKEAYETAKQSFLIKCSGVGGSIIVDPTAQLLTGTTTTTATGTTLPNLGGSLIFGGSGGGFGGGQGIGGEETTTDIVPKDAKKPFPYWLIVVGLIGGYIIFRKK